MGFVRSRSLNRILNLSAAQGKDPSEIMGIEDEYTAFCFNEACTYIVTQIKNGNELHYEKKKKRVDSMAAYFQELGV